MRRNDSKNRLRSWALRPESWFDPLEPSDRRVIDRALLFFAFAASPKIPRADNP
jgi:hypothetical protein